MILSPHEIAWLVLQAGWNGEDAVTMTAICLAESGGDTNVIARSTSGANLGQRDHGLAQISGRWHGDKLQATPRWRDPKVNLAMARRIYLDAGSRFDPWHVFTSGTYLVWVPDARVAAAHPFPPTP